MKTGRMIAIMLIAGWMACVLILVILSVSCTTAHEHRVCHEVHTNNLSTIQCGMVKDKR